MAGDVHVGPGNPLIFRNESGDSLLLRLGNTLQISNDGGNTWTPIGGGSLPSTAILADAATNSAPDGSIERHTSTNGPTSAGFGITDAIELQSAAGNVRRVMTDATILTTATDGSEVARRDIGVMIGGVATPIVSMGSLAGLAALYVGDPAGGIAIYRSGTTLNIFNGSTSAFQVQSAQVASAIKHVFSARMLLGQGASVPSANTLTLGADGNVFPIPGTTTINGITTANWAAGSVIYLKFAGILTVTHNSGSPGGGAVAIKTTTGANVTTAANSIMTLMYDGSFWVQTCPITPGY